METTVNERIKMLRSHFNLSQGDFASKVNCSYGTISNLENGRTATPPQKTMNRIIEATGVNREWLIEGVGEMEIQEIVRVSENEKKASWSEKAFEAIKSKNEHLEAEIEFLRGMLNKLISKPGTANFNEGFDLAELFGGQKLVETVRAAA